LNDGRLAEVVDEIGEGQAADELVGSLLVSGYAEPQDVEHRDDHEDHQEQPDDSPD